MDIVIGVDVGSESLRAGAFDLKGRFLFKVVLPIDVFYYEPDQWEQSSNNIWEIFLKALNILMENLNYNKIMAITFAATCSLVILNQNLEPCTIRSSNLKNNIIMWMDHRAKAESIDINKTKNMVLKTVGGSISLEMEIPKLLWLKKKFKNWESICKVLDLSDFMRLKATNKITRSVCPAVCKWNYQIDLQHESLKNTNAKGYWPYDFYKTIGLPELCPTAGPEASSIALSEKPYLLDECRKTSKDAKNSKNDYDDPYIGYLKIGVQEIDTKHIIVGPSMIDAHAGTLGLLACFPSNYDSPYYDRSTFPETLKHKLALMTGTSNCLLANSDKYLEVPGVWGPYYSVIIPGMYTAEGGQSCAGKGLDFLFQSFFRGTQNTDYTQLTSCLVEFYRQHGDEKKIDDQNLGQILFDDSNGGIAKELFELTRHVHIWPDFNGNRSPFADPDSKGMISGLSVFNIDTIPTSSFIRSDDGHLPESRTSNRHLIALYLSALQSLALGIRLIIERLNANGYEIKFIHPGGGLCHNTLFPKIVADVTDMPVILSNSQENCVMLGAAIMAHFSSAPFQSVQETMLAMASDALVIAPSKCYKSFYDNKYKVFCKMYQDQLEYHKIMQA